MGIQYEQRLMGPYFKSCPQMGLRPWLWIMGVDGRAWDSGKGGDTRVG